MVEEIEAMKNYNSPFFRVPVKEGDPQHHYSRQAVIRLYRQYRLWISTSILKMFLLGAGALVAALVLNFGAYSALFGGALAFFSGYEFRHIKRLEEKRKYIFIKRHYIPYPLW